MLYILFIFFLVSFEVYGVQPRANNAVSKESFGKLYASDNRSISDSKIGRGNDDIFKSIGMASFAKGRPNGLLAPAPTITITLDKRVVLSLLSLTIISKLLLYCSKYFK